MGGLAGDGCGEAGDSVLGDGFVVGKVAAAAAGVMGEKGEGAGLAGTGTRLKRQVIAGMEGVSGGGLFVGGIQVEHPGTPSGCCHVIGRVIV